MRKITKKIFWGLGFAIGAVLLVYVDIYVWKLTNLGIGIEAKILGSGVFVSRRDPASVINEDLHKVVNFIDLEVDHMSYTVTASAFGLIEKKAVYRIGLGCTILNDLNEEQLLSPITVDLKPKPKNQKRLPWPAGDKIQKEEFPPDVDNNKLEKAFDRAFNEPDPENLRRTRAVVVLYDGRIVAERYAQGFSQETPLLGYGMTKSVVNALVGILVAQGKLSLEEPVSVPEWSGPGDPRATITLDQLLRMSSGLEFDDSKPPLTDTIQMLGESDMAAYAVNKPLAAEPGKTWSYSNGTTIIISRIIRYTTGGTDEDYFAFPRRALFDRIGMRSAILEPDVSGTFVGSTYMYATARDWARFGLLYLNNGIWEGERILPEGWVSYSSTPAPSDPHGEYGAHFWLHPGGLLNREKGIPSKLPEDVFFALGHNGQSLTIIPSRKLVVVRLGLTKNPESWNLESFIIDVLEAIQG